MQLHVVNMGARVSRKKWLVKRAIRYYKNGSFIKKASNESLGTGQSSKCSRVAGKGSL